MCPWTWLNLLLSEAGVVCAEAMGLNLRDICRREPEMCSQINSPWSERRPDDVGSSCFSKLVH